MTFHRSLPIDVVGFRNRARNALSLPLISLVITASEERREFFLNHTTIRPPNIRTVPLGIDTARFAPSPSARDQIRSELRVGPEEFLLLSVGHFNPEKGLDRAIDVVAAVAGRMPHVAFRHVILGRGDPERQQALERQAARLIPGRVEFVGFQRAPERWFSAADLLVHTPRLEAFGLVLPQAMACGTPVAAYAVGGIPEIVEEGVGGITATDDDLEALASGIVELLRDRRRLEALADGALDCAVSRFGSARYARNHRAIYEEVLGVGRAPVRDDGTTP